MLVQFLRPLFTHEFDCLEILPLNTLYAFFGSLIHSLRFPLPLEDLKGLGMSLKGLYVLGIFIVHKDSG